MKRALSLAVLTVVFASTLAALVAQTALAAPVHHTSTISLSGTSPEQTIFSGFAVCDDCAPDALFDCGGCQVAAYGTVDVHTSVSWTDPVSIDSQYDATELHQGDTVAIKNSLTPATGPIRIRYRIHYIVGIFACDGNFDPCGSGDQVTKDWQRTNLTIEDDPTVQTGTDCAIPLTGTTTCSKSDTVNVIPETCFFDGCPVDITVDLLLNHTFTISAGNVDVDRTGTFLSPTTQTYGGAVPAVVNDSVTVPCLATPGTDVNYRLGGATYSVGHIQVTGDSHLSINIDGPGPANANPVLDLLSGPVYDDGLTMTGPAADEFTLGDVLLDNKPPVVSAIGQAGSFVEGSELTFTAAATDNCSSTLSYVWDYSDGGGGYDNPTLHTFNDNGHYTGSVSVQDAAGNTTIKNFAVNGSTGVTNGDPSVTPPSNAAAVWGVPISFHADATDPGSADQPTLSYSWDFGDGAGSLGSTVSHAYSFPGTYNVTITVTDKDGGVGTAPMQVVISKRLTSLVYTGAAQASRNKYATLSAQLTDELGNPVFGRTVGWTVGSQTGSSATDGSGKASQSLKVTLKPGSYTVASTFAGDSRYVGSSDSDAFQVK